MRVLRSVPSTRTGSDSRMIVAEATPLNMPRVLHRVRNASFAHRPAWPIHVREGEHDVEQRCEHAPACCRAAREPPHFVPPLWHGWASL